MTRQQPPIPLESADAGVAVISADAFYGHAQPFIAHVSQNFENAHERAVADIGGLVASATNLALAIELYLKGLLLHQGIPPPKTHDLPALFAALPERVQRAVEHAYSALSAKPQAPVTGIELEVAHSDDASQRGLEPPLPSDFTVKAILARNADAFVTWRYLFAHDPPLGAAYLSYEFGPLALAAQSIRQQFGLVQRLHAPPTVP
jgi:hypothetical protein